MLEMVFVIIFLVVEGSFGIFSLKLVLSSCIDNVARRTWKKILMILLSLDRCFWYKYMFGFWSLSSNKFRGSIPSGEIGLGFFIFVDIWCRCPKTLHLRLSLCGCWRSNPLTLTFMDAGPRSRSWLSWPPHSQFHVQNHRVDFTPG